MEFLTRALNNIQKGAKTAMLAAWNKLKYVNSGVGPVDSFELNLSKASDLDKLRAIMQDCFAPKGGDVVARRNTVALGSVYLSLSDACKVEFFKLLAEEFGVDRTELKKQYDLYLQSSCSHEHEYLLVNVLQSPRFKILKQFSSLDNGLKFLVDMRADVIGFIKQEPSLTFVEQDLYKILISWFDVGLLDLKRITWNSPAALLEKLIAYEAVHAINSWQDLRNRLDSDRRCFAFFHHKMSEEPLIFVEVALTDEISSSIHKLLDETLPVLDAKRINTAVFYSISNTQRGLNGISLGNFLIKTVVNAICSEFPNIKTIVTLSPVPGFVRWARTLIDIDPDLLVFFEKPISAVIPEELRTKILSLCVRYIMSVENERAIDNVAHFHFGNGASLEAINWQSNLSQRGLKQSLGIMVNYKYDLDKIDILSHEYSSNGNIAINKCIKKEYAQC